jgi:hypothetical protein
VACCCDRDKEGNCELSDLESQGLLGSMELVKVGVT